jgi:hypothetical protein
MSGRTESVCLKHPAADEPGTCYGPVDVPVTFEGQSDDTTRPHPGKLPPGYYIAGTVPEQCPECGHIFAQHERTILAGLAEREAQEWHDDYDAAEVAA